MRYPLHGAQFVDLSLQTGICSAVQLGVFDADGKFAGDGLQERDLVVGELPPLQSKEVDYADENLRLAAPAKNHRHRDLRRVHVLSGSGDGKVGRVLACIRRRNHLAGGSSAAGDRRARM